ncbi:hypothetical protein M409DRAFT_59879 [Zasmidium cellare ATCC 36951]|uniref:Major facilitator superfamily (MFS) profile domain-containing protein n=1 Tax=Zasmidium cellare ATCC 36951 TaxID=1080233 RepID=A0A6A6C0P6_ZASCE|nr:uncharacterized protein M409DRAFT_59879 [Zasmidium cellare ATCC 36951]KAF2160627.1 hypothetical protein M409DRAFT_59879 [Zasmidium cellare ATCC 36951]
MALTENGVRRSRFQGASRWLWFCVFVYALSDIGYGYDTSMFGSVQALPSFLHCFGEIGENGKRKLGTGRTSIMNSVIWGGKLADFRNGRNWYAFAIGRTIAYYTTGLVTTCAPTYGADISPAPLRSICSGAMTFFIALGQIWANAMSRGFVSVESASGWRTICAMQFMPAVVVIALAPLTPGEPLSHLLDI